jgi:hypothetical protein
MLFKRDIDRDIDRDPDAAVSALVVPAARLDLIL